MVLYTVTLKVIYKNKAIFLQACSLFVIFIHEKCPHTCSSTTYRTEWFFNMAFMDTYSFAFNRTEFLSCLHSFHLSIL